MFKSALLALAVVSSGVEAAEVTLHTFTWHARNEYCVCIDTKTSLLQRDYNRSNLGIGFVSDDGWTIGTYRNSYYENTIYLGYTWRRKVVGQLEVGVVAVAATGYELPTGKRVTPVGSFTLGYPVTEKVTVRLLGIPKVSSTATGLLHLSFGFKL